jgi:MoxR-like ATPase
VRTTPSIPPEAIHPVVTRDESLAYQQVVRRVPVADAVVRYAVTLVRQTRPADGSPDFIRQWLAYGASVRAAQALVLGGKARRILFAQRVATPAEARTELVRLAAEARAGRQ